MVGTNVNFESQAFHFCFRKLFSVRRPASFLSKSAQNLSKLHASQQIVVFILLTYLSLSAFIRLNVVFKRIYYGGLVCGNESKVTCIEQGIRGSLSLRHLYIRRIVAFIYLRNFGLYK